MALTDLISRSRRSLAPQRYNEDSDSFLTLHREMNRIFDDFARGFGAPLASRDAAAGWPHVEIAETDKEVTVHAELPGLEQKDVELSLTDGILTLKGSKHAENNGATYSERWSGHFQRSLQLGAEIDPDHVQASFKNGVLTVTLAKRPEAQSPVKRIPISAG